MHTGRDTLDDDLFRCGLTPIIPYANDLTNVGEADPPPPRSSPYWGNFGVSLHRFKVLDELEGNCKGVKYVYMV